MMSRASTVGAALIVAALLGAGCDAGPKTNATAKVSATPAPTAAAPVAAAPAAAVPAPAPTPATGESFGAGVKLTESTPIDQILADPKAFAGKTVRAEGMIVDVCPKRGCWLELAGTAPGQKLRFKVVDGEMVFPMDAKGKYAVTEGVLSVRDLTLEESVEYAKYQAEETGVAFDPATVTKPLVVVRLDGTGALLRDKL